jgi:hypothetical protein
MFTRKVGFWLAVAGTAILANFGLELAAAKIPSTGLRRFVAFVHCGPGGQA